jgi:hypothetical protein
VDLAADRKSQLIAPRTNPKYTLDQLLPQGQKSGRKKPDRTQEDRDWIELALVGREL